MRQSAGRNVVSQLLSELDGAVSENEGVYLLGGDQPSVGLLLSWLPRFAIAFVLSWAYLGAGSLVEGPGTRLAVSVVLSVFFTPLLGRLLKSARLQLIRRGWWVSPR